MRTQLRATIQNRGDRFVTKDEYVKDSNSPKVYRVTALLDTFLANTYSADGKVNVVYAAVEPAAEGVAVYGECVMEETATFEDDDAS